MGILMQMVKLVGVEFAPFLVPLERRLQTLAVFHYVSMFIIVPLFTIWVMIWLIFYTHYWWLTAIYGLWFVYDFDTPRCGARPASWYRNASIWRWLRDYFPIQLEKTEDLPPNKNYIIGAHPHGLFSIGSFCNFCTESTGFSKLYPGISCHMLTLVGQFWFPLRREYIMLAGACEVSRSSMTWLLTQPTVGHAIVVVLGGASEALDAHPGQVKLVLKRRKGFVKMAILHGADIVPSFSFGENELFNQVDNPPGSFVRRVQDILKGVLGFSLPVFHGRGMFNYSFGILPYRKAITTIVGAPIHVQQCPTPTIETIETLHQEYVDGLCALFENNKMRFGYKDSDHICVV